MFHNNDLVNVNNDVQFIMFADDTNMLMCDKNIKSLEISATHYDSGVIWINFPLMWKSVIS